MSELVAFLPHRGAIRPHFSAFPIDTWYAASRFGLSSLSIAFSCLTRLDLVFTIQNCFLGGFDLTRRFLCSGFEEHTAELRRPHEPYAPT
jgi:hypothetical protein